MWLGLFRGDEVNEVLDKYDDLCYIESVDDSRKEYVEVRMTLVLISGYPPNHDGLGVGYSPI